MAIPRESLRFIKNPGKRKAFRAAILRWGSEHRRWYPWREPKATPFHLLVAEMLLRKTRADNVLPVFERIVGRYPDVGALGRSRIASLEKALTPLGLHRIRARALKGICERISREGGAIPDNYEDLARLPHLGRYGASAVLCFAYGRPMPIVDGNVVRLWNRIFSIPPPRETHKDEGIWEFTAKLMPRGKSREFNWALLDLAALVCIPKMPKHQECPAKRFCQLYLRETG